MPVDFMKAPTPPRKFNWNEDAKILKAHPDQWALVTPAEDWPGADTPGSINSAVVRVNSGKVKAMPKGEFQATARGNQLYVRYIGGSK